MGAKTDAALNAILSQTPKSLKGPYKAKVLETQPLEGHTIYSPSDPPPTGQKWPGFIYHNNGCLAIGKVDQKIVLEISSFGYYVIADGNINATFTSGPGGGPNFAPSDTGIKAIEWVVDQAEKGKLPDVDATKFGVGGTSCGGILSYNTLQHKRVLAAAIISSGLFGGAGREKLKDLKKPIGFFEGGPFDGGESLWTSLVGFSDSISIVILTIYRNQKRSGRLQHPYYSNSLGKWSIWTWWRCRFHDYCRCYIYGLAAQGQQDCGTSFLGR